MPTCNACNRPIEQVTLDWFAEKSKKFGRKRYVSKVPRICGRCLSNVVFEMLDALDSDDDELPAKPVPPVTLDNTDIA